MVKELQLVRDIDPIKGLLHGPYKPNKIKSRVSFTHHAFVIVVVVAQRRRPLCLLAEHKPANGTLSVAPHPRDNAVVVEHMVAGSHQNSLIGHEILQANGTTFVFVLLLAFSDVDAAIGAEKPSRP